MTDASGCRAPTHAISISPIRGAGGETTQLELMRASLVGILARVRVVKDVGTTTAMSMSSIEVTAGKAGIGTHVDAKTRPVIFGIADPDGEDPPDAVIDRMLGGPVADP